MIRNTTSIESVQLRVSTGTVLHMMSATVGVVLWSRHVLAEDAWGKRRHRTSGPDSLVSFSSSTVNSFHHSPPFPTHVSPTKSGDYTIVQRIVVCRMQEVYVRRCRLHLADDESTNCRYERLAEDPEASSLVQMTAKMLGGLNLHTDRHV